MGREQERRRAGSAEDAGGSEVDREGAGKGGGRGEVRGGGGVVGRA